MIQPEVGRPLVYTDYDPRGQLAIPDFLRLLDAYAPERAAQLRSGHPGLVKALERGQRLVTERRYQEAQVWRTEIVAALAAIAPDGTYFGSTQQHPDQYGFYLRQVVPGEAAAMTPHDSPPPPAGDPLAGTSTPS